MNNDNHLWTPKPAPLKTPLFGRSNFTAPLRSFGGVFERCSALGTSAEVVVPPFSVLYWMTMTVYRWPARDLRRLEGEGREVEDEGW